VRKDGPLISPYTVNDTTEQLTKLFTRAKLWGVRFEHEPQWRKHWLKEPEEQPRELVGDEGERLEAATRDDYAPFFVAASGLRQKQCVTLKWSDVDWSAKQIKMPGKGGKWETVPITSTIGKSYGRCKATMPSASLPTSPNGRAMVTCGTGVILSPVKA
jgi:integrase